MSNSQQMKKGLSVRDLITTGILAALYMVCAMIGEAIFGFFPVLTFLCPLSIALLCGPVYMLILAKVPKHGPIIVTGILVGGVLFVLGMYWSMCLAYEDLLQKALAKLSEGKTVLVIAHRLSSIKEADSIVVLEQGKVIDCGTHDGLINRCSPYQDMWAAFEQSDQWKMGGVNA